MFKKKPFFIVFEGVEGCGKSYQSKKLFNKLKKINFEKDERLQWNLFMNQFLNYSILHGRATDNYLPSWVQ